MYKFIFLFSGSVIQYRYRNPVPSAGTGTVLLTSSTSPVQTPRPLLTVEINLISGPQAHWVLPLLDLSVTVKICFDGSPFLLDFGRQRQIATWPLCGTRAWRLAATRSIIEDHIRSSPPDGRRFSARQGGYLPLSPSISSQESAEIENKGARI